MPKISMFGARKKVAMPLMPVDFCRLRRGISTTRIKVLTGAMRRAPRREEVVVDVMGIHSSLDKCEAVRLD